MYTFDSEVVHTDSTRLATAAIAAAAAMMKLILFPPSAPHPRNLAKLNLAVPSYTVLLETKRPCFPGERSGVPKARIRHAGVRTRCERSKTNARKQPGLKTLATHRGQARREVARF